MGRTTYVPTVAIMNVPDFTDDEGNWFKSASTVHDGVIYQYRTRSFCVWAGVNSRTMDLAYMTNRRPNYLGCKNLFSDFNSFTEWCLSQHGYLNREVNGKYWQLDKDMLVLGNKNYGPDTCMFVPCHINNLFQSGISKNSTSNLPIGVMVNQQGSGFIAQCKVHYKNSARIGRFDTPESAHQAWQGAKIGEILYHAGRDELGQKLQGALFEHATRIQADLDNNRQTFLY